MKMIRRILDMFLKLFSKNNDAEETQDSETKETLNGDELQEEVPKKLEVENVIFNKLNHLEQYIKMFSLTFKEEYNRYCTRIHEMKEEYTKELDKYNKSLKGDISFSIDPERESERYVEVLQLESEIKEFVESEFEYKVCRDKFSKLCCKLNRFYNALNETSVTTEVIVNQINNASNSLEGLVKELNDYEFINKNSRKKDIVLNYVLYCEYVIFKVSLRTGIVKDFEEYKNEISKVKTLFIEEDYDDIIFKFFMESLETIQDFIVANLSTEKMYEYVLNASQDLQTKLEDYKACFDDCMFFDNVLALENTLYSIIKPSCIEFKFDISKIIEFKQTEVISTNNIAKSILCLIGNKKSILLYEIINSFKVEISWREFYFLCKIFELDQDVVETSDDTLFSIVKNKFNKLKEKYTEYSDSYIKSEKQKVLSYNGSKDKKYVLVLKLKNNEEFVVSTLNSLCLDFVVANQEVYLIHLYFNGFKNLGENFGQYKIF